jgi:hypothetical protein
MQDYSEWHRCRRNYGLWLIELASEDVCEMISAAKEHLSDFLLTPYHRQPHISLFICGFPARVPQFDDDFSTEQLHVQKELLKRADIKPFTVEVGRLNSFASAPYLEVRDLQGGLDRIRVILSRAAREIGRNTFIPHVTIGLYSAVLPSCMVKKASGLLSFSIRSVLNGSWKE